MSSGGDQLSVKDYFTSNSIEQFEFADGVTFDGFTVQESIFSFGGGAGVDVLTGNSRSTRFEGKEGNDTIRPGGGDDTIDGGEGEDTVIFAGRRSDYDISVVASAAVAAANINAPQRSRTVATLQQRTIQATNPDVFLIPEGARVIVTDLLGDEGTNTIDNVEQLQFANEAENIAPIAVDDALTADEDQVLRIGFTDLIANDTDEDQGILKLSAVQAIAGGSVVLESDAVVFTPDSEFSGEAKFAYTLIDRQGGEAQAEVTITIAEVNDAPVFDGALDDISIKATTGLSYTVPAERFTDADSAELNIGVLQVQ
jgi:Ca2+-binding RTX toxin-like protein